MASDWCWKLVLAASSLCIVSAKGECQLEKAAADRIISYQTKVDGIIQAALSEENKGRSYRGLKDLVTRFGPRPSGSSALEDAINRMEVIAKADGFRVSAETVMVPHWVRGKETLKMLKPRVKNMAVLGLGTSIGTQQHPAGTLHAEAVVVTSFEEMEKLGEEKIRSRIVILNAEFGSPEDSPLVRYISSNKYRVQGARRAAVLGAVSVLVRSRTDYSLYTPHTGVQVYGNTTSKIPAAAITVEDANLLQRLYSRGETIELMLVMGAANLPERESRNLLIEYGPEVGDAGELLVLSAHMDSWDVGSGAIDDGAGVLVNYEAMRLLKSLDLEPPRRTIRVIVWTAEEVVNIGGKEHIKNHASEADRIQAAIENDLGAFRPLGMRFSGSERARCMVSHVTGLLGRLNATRTEAGASHMFRDLGVPSMNIAVEQTRYFWYHHTEADTMDALDPHEMDLCVATMAAAIYVLADMPDRLPR